MVSATSRTMGYRQNLMTNTRALLCRYFKDEKAIFYPTAMNVLVIVEKTANQDGWFPLVLQLSSYMEESER